MIRIHNLETNEIIDREMNDDEYNNYLQAEAKEKIQEEQKAEIIAKRQSALAKLAALGLTEDEIAAL